MVSAELFRSILSPFVWLESRLNAPYFDTQKVHISLVLDCFSPALFWLFFSLDCVSHTLVIHHVHVEEYSSGVKPL
jgi:hypothetical protein